MAVVRANYLRRGQTARLSRGVAYYTWREEANQAHEANEANEAKAPSRMRPRTWSSADGRTLDYATARQEITTAAEEAACTYRLVLSTAETPLTPEAYGAVLDGQFACWYLVAHHGGEHPHAHCVAFSDRRLSRSDLGEVRQALGEAERVAERVQARGLVQDADTADHAHAADAAEAVPGCLASQQAAGVEGQARDRGRGEEMERWS